MNANADATELVLPAAEPAPEPPYEPLDEADDSSWLWEHYRAGEVPFIKLALMERLLRRPYHAVTLEGPINVKQLAEDYRDRTFRSETNMDRCGNPKLDLLLLRLEGEVFTCLENDALKIYAPTPDAAQAAARQFRRYVKPQAAGKPRCYIISVDATGPHTETVPLERTAPVSTDDLALHYGEDFPAWEQQWTERMRRTPSGLTIFHGPPGCGKTSYLRALMARLLDKAVFFFVPVSEAQILSNPSFVNFWIAETRRHQKKTKIVLLEDAEELLLPRDGDNRDKVSTLLNLADGFLGDHLKLHIIATTNAPVRELDAALLRPGRLVGSRFFRRLTRPEAQRLAAAKGLALPEQDDYSLAELYYGAVEGVALKADRLIGFGK